MVVTLNMKCPQEGSGKGSVTESVLIPVMREGGWKPRMTLCVSSQASTLKDYSKLTQRAELAAARFFSGKEAFR